MSRSHLILFSLSLAVLPAVLQAQETPSAFLRRPDIHGDQIVFTAEGDLWLTSVRGGVARRLTTHDGTETAAHFSPDGRQIAFTGQYDGATEVYVMPTEGGTPRRLTYGAVGTVQGWTPDGKNVLFRSRRLNPENKNRLWSVPATGGIPQLLPIPHSEFAAMNPDGKRIAYVPVSGEWQHWKRYQGGQADDIWLTDIQSKSFKKLTDFPGVDTAPTWAGGELYFVSERNGIANLYRMDAAGKRVMAITTYPDYDVRYPASDGEKVVFEHGNGIEVYDPKTGDTKPVDVRLNSERIHARPHRIAMAPTLNSVSLGPTGKRLAIEARGQLITVPVENGDYRAIAPLPGSRSEQPVWSPDGKSIAFISDRSGEEQLWIAPALGTGAPRQIKMDHKGPLYSPIWSPDGKKIALGDRELRILVVDVASGAVQQVDQSEPGGSYDSTNDSYRFSPDGRWLAYNKSEPNRNDVVYLYELETGKRIPVTSPEMNSYGPSWDPTGKFLVFLSDRSFNPHNTGATHFFTAEKTTRVTLLPLSADTPSPFLPTDEEEGEEAAAPAPRPAAPAGEKPVTAEKPSVRIDADGIQDRVIDVPVAADRFTTTYFLDGGRILLFSIADTDTPGPRGVLRLFDIKRKDATVIASRFNDFDVSQNRRKLLLMTGKEVQVVDLTGAPIAPGAGRVDLSGYTLEVNPEAEWRQIFAEGWRIGRDFFYDPGLHGVDWDRVKQKYSALLPAVADRSDLNFVLGEMIAELNTGHAYVNGGDLSTPPAVPMGYLGADMEAAPEGTAFRITQLFPGDGFDLSTRSPLLEPGLKVKPGDFIVAIGGQPVKTDRDLEAYLIGTAGRVISLSVNNTPSLEGAREIRIRPMANEAKSRYYAWVASRREYVRTHGGEDLAYIHIPDMVGGGLQEFIKHYYPNILKPGIIYDVRNNGGGYISAMLLLPMSSRRYAYFKPRHGLSWTRQEWAPVGHGVALCNEQSGSNAEEFSDAFQRLKIGPVIGTRTWGGEVGSGGGYPLIDGGKLYIPNYGAWTPDGKWIIEGTGVQPDVTVEQDPAAVLAGRDPQLDRAIAYLKQKIAADPVKIPSPPPFPVKALHPITTASGAGK